MEDRHIKSHMRIDLLQIYHQYLYCCLLKGGTMNATHVHSDFYFKNDTIKFINNGSHQYYISFEIESSIECQVEMYFAIIL